MQYNSFPTVSHDLLLRDDIIFGYYPEEERAVGRYVCTCESIKMMFGRMWWKGPVLTILRGRCIEKRRGPWFGKPNVAEPTDEQKTIYVLSYW
jgi:hypothetical protein